MGLSTYDHHDPQYWIDRAAETIVADGTGALFDSELSSLSNAAWREAVVRRVEQLLAGTDDSLRRGHARDFLQFFLPSFLGKAVSGERVRVRPVQIECVSIGETLSQKMALDPSAIHGLSPDEFEEFFCEQLFSMNFEPKRVGPINRKDGGIDVVFWSRGRVFFPFLGAAQLKHHRNPSIREGPRTVRDFAGALSGHPFNVGIILTNTSFSPDAQWFAANHAQLIRLRDFEDIQRWLRRSFEDESEWRDIPSAIELCPGVVIKIRAG